MLELKNISKSFNRHLVLDSIDLFVPSQSIYGLLGPNGAGKTTLLRIVSSLLKPSTGSVNVTGIDLATNAKLVRAKIGIVNNAMGLYERLSGRENLRFFAELYCLPRTSLDQRIRAVCEQLEIGTWIDQRASGYSTGMRQKILVARAILHEPALLILDEASNGLDVFARRSLLQSAVHYAQIPGRAVIYSTHVLSEADEICTHAAIIQDGKLLVAGAIDLIRTQASANKLEECFFYFSDRAGQVHSKSEPSQ
jgi:sodium transport system ATP-binding protein